MDDGFTRVLLWSIPRGLSTAFERSVRELTGIKVLHEPHQNPFYHGPDRKSNAFDEVPDHKIEPDITFEATEEQVCRHYHGFDTVFVKDLAFHMEGRYKDCITGPLALFKHTFLIRNPVKAIVSLYVSSKGSCFACDFSNMAGFRQIYELFQIIQQVDPNPIIIDADDLLDNPEGMMKQYCSATGLPFSKDMLNWSPGVVSDWMSCHAAEVWHGSVMNSSGFIKPQASKPVPNLSEYPKVVTEVVEASLPYYRAMYDIRLKPTS